MKISHNWLREFVAFTSTPEQLSNTLNMMGIEVESFEDRRELYTNFVTAKVLSKEKHPKADKLSVCQVFDGSVERTVVCGAPNVDAGQIIVFAQPGAIVPNGGFEISARVLRGIESNGMICSKSELKLEDDTEGIWVLEPDTPIGEPIGTALGLADVIYEISITPNRADALSHLGIARIVAAIERLPVQKPQARVNESSEAHGLNVEIKDEVNCGRYMARVLRGVSVGPSPRWMRVRLESVGLRPRNAVVDITNYVLMECGHPLHAFDASVVRDNTIVVECATDSEKYITLDGKERELDSSSLMICDPSQRLAVAGVMGGENSSIKDQTTEVLIESAWFNPSSIRRTARRLSINSDASYRFERGTDISNLPYALERAAQLMSELCGAEVLAGVVDAYPQAQTKAPIVLRFERLRTILGFGITNDEVCDLLERLDCGLSARSNEQVLVNAPTYRVDLNEEIDLIEDVAILWNYDNIPLLSAAEVSFAEEALPPSFVEPPLKRRLRGMLASLGLREIVTQNQIDPGSESILNGDGVPLANPLGVELSIMRSSLVASALKVVAHNIRQGASAIRVFEFGKTFHRPTDSAERDLTSVHEREELLIVLCGDAQNKEWNAMQRSVDFFDIKGLCTTLLQSSGVEPEYLPSQSQEFGPDQLAISLGGVQVGVVGELSRKVCKAIDVDKTVFALRIDCAPYFAQSDRMRTYRPVSNFPLMQRDLAFVVDNSVPASTIQRIIESNGSAILQSVHVFDLFEHASLGQSKKSLAFSLTFSSDERTLTDEEVDVVVKTIVNAAEQQLGATLRS